MVAEKIDRELNKLEMILNRHDGDIYLIGVSIIESLRLENERVRGLEENAIFVNPVGLETVYAPD